MNHDELGKKLYDVLGGKENICSAYNCMTRLRVQVKRKDEVLFTALKKVPGVMGIHDTEEELQIILGPGTAAQVTGVVNQLLERAAKPKIGDGRALHQQIRERNATPAKLLLKKIASIFIPLIPGFIACGLLTGILGVAAKIAPEITGTPLFQLLAVAGNAVFWGMNLFVGYNAAKVFGGTPILGGALAALICHPGLANVVLAGDKLVPGRGGVMAVILISFVAAWLEKHLHRLIPTVFDLFLTPLLTFLLAGTAAIFVLQPLGGAASSAIGTVATGAVGAGGALVGFVLAGLWLPLVMMGIHQAMTPIHADLIAQYGVTILLPILAMAGAGQVGAAIAVYVKSKNKFLKKTVASALPVGLMGVGEPLIYGVTLPLGRPFIGACIGGAFGGAVQAHFMVGASAMGISGLPLAGTTNNIPIYLLGIVIAYLAGFVATYVLGFDDPSEEKES
ncbi:MAG: PTS transporter subunit EIIC [Selenomonas sp.]|uniref:PTS transporter subunit EIIC n=1 Tax=Selenomonas sp. TaxID=2053611 RepID=UPI0025EDCBA8|nr:PTS transporter subunit EIIC [Selenomonas sp.]MCR5757156.1 PTS transporter subunit EIIC [Selenomonas sp.]